MAKIRLVQAPATQEALPMEIPESLKLDAPDWFTVGSTTPATHVGNVAAGRHPFGGPLGPAGSRCRDCAHKRNSDYARRYWKCEKHRPWTSGLASDLRLKWRGCHLFEPAARGDGDEGEG